MLSGLKIFGVNKHNLYVTRNQDIHVTSNPELPWEKQHSVRRSPFRQQIGLEGRK